MSTMLTGTRRDFLAGAATVAGAVTVAANEGVAQTTAGPSPTTAKTGFWPNGARLVISVSMQFEAGAQGDRADGPFPPIDEKYFDSITPTWFAYGMNEGIPRMLDLWDRHGVKVTSHIVGRAAELRPDLAQELVRRGHEAAAHGQTWTPQFSMTPDEERKSYEDNIATVERITGKRPIGFNAFWMRQTKKTLEILQDLGFLYHIDDLGRDEPSITDVRGKPFAVVPYTLRNNDIGRFSNTAMTGAAFAQELKDDFDVLYAEAGQRRRLMSISTHDRIGGQPAVVKALDSFLTYARQKPDVAFMRKDEIARWALAQPDTPKNAPRA